MAITKLHSQRIQDAPQSASMARQAVINGNFDVWQRGTSFTNPASAQYTADRFSTRSIVTGTPPTNIIHSRQALTPGDLLNSFYFYRINPDGAGSGFGASDWYGIRQSIEFGTRNLAGLGKSITLSFYARSSIGSKKLGINVFQQYGTGGSPTSAESIAGTFWTLTSNWTKYTHTFDLNTIVGKTFGTNNDDALLMDFAVMWGSTRATNYGDTVAESFVGSGNIDIAQVQLCSGSEALPFEPKSYEQELASCQRYYYKIYPGVGIVKMGFGYNTATTTAFIYNTFPVTMRTAPTAIEVTSTASDYSVAHQATATTCSSVPTFASGDINSATTTYTVASGLTVGQGSSARSNSANAYMAWSAEL